MLLQTKHRACRTITRLPWLGIGIMVVVATPVLVALASAFVDQNQFSLSHFKELTSDAQRLVGLAMNTSKVSAVAVLVSGGLGIPLGFFLFRTNLPFRSLFKTILIATCCLPPYSVVTCWMNLFDLDIWSSAILAAGWVAGLTYVPLVALMSGLAFRSVDSELEEISLLSTSPFRTFLHITLPQAGWGVVAAILAVVILTISDITITDIVLVRTFTEEVFAEFQLNRTHGPAAAVAIPILVAATLLGITLAWLLRNTGLSLEQTDVTRSLTYKLRRWKLPCILFALVTLIVITAPFVALIGQTESLHNVIDTLKDVKTELRYSLILGGLAAIVTSVLAWGPAILLARTRRWRFVVLGWIILLMVTPAPLIGIGLARVFNRHGPLGDIYDSPLIVAIAFVVRFLPYHVLVLTAALRSIPQALEQEALLAGATRLQTLTRIIAPLCLKSMIFGAILVLILSLGEVGASILVVPPGQTTLTIHFFTLIHYGVYSAAATICLLLAASVVIPSAALGICIRRSQTI